LLKKQHYQVLGEKTSRKERIMSLSKGKNFSTKHGPDEKPDLSVKNEITRQTKNKNISCAVAFKIAAALQISPKTVGKTADLMNIKLIKCQLGLFGYQPQKKIVKPQDPINQDIKNAVSRGLDQRRLSCKRAWDIASRLNVSKMTVSSACETMGVKIKNCQLGAF
jgi:DNA-binding CsgD family transcriptional regulator